MKTANKGEWSELWAFVQSMATGKIDLCDEHLTPLIGQQLPLQKVFREDVIFDLSDPEHISFKLPDATQIQVSRSLLRIEIKEFFKEFTNAKGRAFSCISGEKLLKKFHQSEIKAPSRQKKDIEFEILDPKVLIPRRAGFSIKSQLGGKSTLLNASRDNTNFCFEIVGGQFDINSINSISSGSKIKDRVNALIDAKCSFKFSHCKGAVFNQNLTKIDSQMPELLGWATLLNFVMPHGKKNLTDVLADKRFQDSAQTIAIPLDAGSIEYKFKHLLSAIALGMVPATPWSGIIDADGGYLVVKRNGDLVCFHVYNLGSFQEYLLRHVMFDTPASRNNFGFIYERNGQFFFDVNCQIRFNT
jgi:hypothetical protein